MAMAAAEPQLRPAFTAFQQHYSPAKSLAPKPLTSAFLAPPSPSKLPANVAASAETNRLQTELLQLHLLHRDAGAVDAAWHASARVQLKARFRKLADWEAEVGALERRRAEHENVAALRRWTGRGSTASMGTLEEMVRTVDNVLGTLWRLGEPGGRYTRCVGRFEQWAQALEGVIDRRRLGVRLGSDTALGGDGQAMFVSELDAAWKDDCAGLARRLDECRRMLRDFGSAPDEPSSQSGLAVVLHACQTLINDMLAELHLMEQMEREAVAEENDWVRVTNKNMTMKEGDGDPRAGAIWRAL